MRWGQAPALNTRGVYVVARTSSADDAASAIDQAPMALDLVEDLLVVRPELRLDGRRPTAPELAARIGEFWARDEPALYIGRAGTAAKDVSLARRMRAYYRTPLGKKRPHGGGWFLKILEILDELHVHYVAAADPRAAEDVMIAHYIARISATTRDALRDPERAFPFANLEYPRGTRKLHGITGATGD